jgi:molecular chaperone GrpE
MIKDTHNNEKENKKSWGAEEHMPGESGIETRNGENASIKDKAGEAREKEPEANLAEDTVSVLKGELSQKHEEIEKKKEEIESMKDLLKRRQADFENYKKRIVKSQEEYRKGAIKDMAQDIIHINDDLLRAIDAAFDVCEDKQSTQSAFIEGIAMISRRIEEMLKKFGVVEIDCLNKEFDPNVNEAVEIEESGDVEKDTVTRVYQKGFLLDEYVVRSAKVKVTRRPRVPNNKSGDAAPESARGEDGNGSGT